MRLFPSTRHHRSGQALVEFAVISFCFTLLFSGILMLGFLIFGANVLHQAADVGAMEFARFPAPPCPESPTDNPAFFYDQLDASGLYSEAKLVITQAEYDSPGDLPLINRLLLSLYVYDPDLESQTDYRYRYPGALLKKSDGDIYSVLIPIVSYDLETGAQTIGEWRRVVEEVCSKDPENSGQLASQGPYSLSSSTPGALGAGVVALRINYPYQSAAMVGYVHPPDEDAVDGIVNVPVEADDSEVTDNASFPDGYEDYQLANLTPSSNFDVTPHRGRYGLGETVAFATQVRPYRKVISAQGIYRREIFGQ